jgi:hypothetical protein
MSCRMQYNHAANCVNSTLVGFWGSIEYNTYGILYACIMDVCH